MIKAAFNTEGKTAALDTQAARLASPMACAKYGVADWGMAFNGRRVHPGPYLSPPAGFKVGQSTE